MIGRRNMKSAAGMVFALAILVGCQSKQDAAIEQAKKQAAATGQAQQVVSVDKNGNTTTTTVQPPVAGQAAQAVTTTVTPATATPASNAAVVPADQPAVAGQPAVADQPAAPVAGGNPVIQPADVKVPAGTSLAIRINQHISVKRNHAGDRFDGEVVEPVVGENNQVVIPKDRKSVV